MRQACITKNSKETKELGEKIAKQILKDKNAVVIGLKGELGGGKTTFMQGFSKGLGVKEKILSPTFVILKKFKINNSKYLYHIDCYRLDKKKDLLDLGFKEIISDPKNIVVVEWADKAKEIMPKNIYWISFEFIDENRRRIIVDNSFSV